MSALSISFTILEILTCNASKFPAVIIASLFPLAPACARPLKFPCTIILSPAITSAPALTSPIITTLPFASIFWPDLTEPLWKIVSEFSIFSL